MTDLQEDNWILHLALIWQGLNHITVLGMRRPILAIGPKNGKMDISWKSK
jgi:hypothetical protein